MDDLAPQGVEVTVGADSYSILMLDPWTATDFVYDVISIVGPEIGVIVDAMGAEGAKKASKAGAAAKSEEDLLDDAAEVLGQGAVERILTLFFQRCPKTKQREFITQLAKVTQVVRGDKKPQLHPIFSVHFAGRPGATYAWLFAAFKVQLAPLVAELGGLGAVAQRMGLARFLSPST